MPSTIKALNLGCGPFYKEGYLNVDIDPATRTDVLCDLSVFPWPFPDEEFDLIEAEHVLEHLNDPFGAMKECSRILKAGGRLLIKVPHFSRGLTHPDHKRGFDLSFPCYFSPSFKWGYSGTEFVMKRVRFRWFSQLPLKKTVLSSPLFYLCSAIGWVFDWLANLAPIFCSRCWAFWVGGFEVIEFHFVKPEKDFAKTGRP